MRARTIGAIAAAVALLLTGCSGNTDGTDTAASPDGSNRPAGTNAPVVATAASLERFDDCPELLGYLRREGVKRVGPYGLTAIPGRDAFALEAPTAGEESGRIAGAAEATAQDSGGDAKSFSGTNVQEAGVDEPDTIKSNGDHIFTTRSDQDGGRLRLTAIAADPRLGRLAGELTLPEESGTDLLLDGDRLLVIGGAMGHPAGPAMDIAVQPGAGRTTVAVIDVTDPAKMRLQEVVTLEGSYASARLVDGVARLVLTSSTAQRLRFTQPESGNAQEARESLAENRRIAQRATLAQWLPRFNVKDAAGDERAEGPLATCSSTFAPKTFSGFDTTTVVTIDPDAPNPRNSAAVVGGAGTIYASADNLYVATQRYPEPQPLALDQPGGVIAPDVVPVPAETSLHRFDIRDPAKAVYAASGKVAGTVLNQWSMSEHDGHLRVATTEDVFSRDGANRSKNAVTVLDARGAKLSQVGRIGDLGIGERIYGVRFIGSLGYVVTFRQVDPLHVLDFGKPASPKLLGELKIPGYSAYLHPVGEGILLGVGQDADPETGGTLGTQLSLFDVQDPTRPRRVDSVRIAGASSPIEWDHHAFTWWGPQRLAIVPVSSYGASDTPVRGGPEKVEERQMHAAVGYRVSATDIREIGRASHARHVDDPGLGQIQRSLVIDGTVYTLSPAGLLASRIDSFDEQGWASFG